MPKLDGDCVKLPGKRSAWDSFFWKLVAACQSFSFRETNERHEDVFDNGDLVPGDVTSSVEIAGIPG